MLAIDREGEEKAEKLLRTIFIVKRKGEQHSLACVSRKTIARGEIKARGDSRKSDDSQQRSPREHTFIARIKHAHSSVVDPT
jgi:hypothetical protein